MEWRALLGGWQGRLGRLLLDSLIMAGAYFTAFLLRFEFQAPWWGWGLVATSFVTVWAVQSIALELFGCNRLLWRYLSVSDVPRFIWALGSSTVVLLLLRLLYSTAAYMGVRPPYSIIFFNSFLAAGGLLVMRLLWRLACEGESANGRAGGGHMRRVLLVGAGAAGNLVAQELRRQGGRRQVVAGFLDDDPVKLHTRIQGYPVLGDIDSLPRVVRKHGVDEVIVSMVRVPRNVIRRVVRLCDEAQVAARIVPGYFELIDGSLTASHIRDIDVSDLLGRQEMQPDNGAVIELLRGKRVLVSGAGGSIGSELSRQILRCGPEELVLVERSENALYEIERELRRYDTAVRVVPVLADVGDRQRMEQLFSGCRPQIVMHAAAHKHVPLVERNAEEALDNNVLGTRVLGEVAAAHGVERFVFVSTDKAVRPVSVMGLTKRLAELVLQDLNRVGTLFSAVRFGNVLDSSGSVVPLFREQIKRGGPVTVTHPAMQRYFMTIAEAVSLVLQAAALARGGEIFVLDMGEPVKIAELAEEMIALSGLRPHEDVQIVYSGIRPGEKLFEELDVSEQSAYRTGHARIFISKISGAPAREAEEILRVCRRLAAEETDGKSLRAELRRLAGEDAVAGT